MVGGTTGQFKYASLNSPVVLAAGAIDYVASQETAGGDSWYNYDTTVTTTSVATELSPTVRSRMFRPVTALAAMAHWVTAR